MKKILAIGILFFVFTISVTSAAEPFVEISFREAELVDVLRSIADFAGKNVLICSEIRGTVTAELKNISFYEAWEGIIYSYGLAYLEKDNLLLVGFPEKIETLEFEEKIKITELKGASPEETVEWAREIFPEIKVAFDSFSSSLILSGERKRLNELEKAISFIDRPVKKKETKIEVVKIGNFPIIEGKKIITTFFPEIKALGQGERNTIILKGNLQDIKKAKDLLKTIDEPPAEEKLVIKNLDYGNPEMIGPLLQDLFPEIEVKTETRLNRLLIRGKPENLKDVFPALEELDQPRALVGVEFKIKEVSSHFFREKGLDLDPGATIGVFKKNTLLNGAGINISLEKLIGFLEEEGVSETLARPSLTTLDGIKGTLHIGDRIPVRGERNNREGQQEINYLQTGIIISFTPRVSGDNYITLEVKPEVSTIGEELVGGFPRIRTREAETVIRIKSGETFAIGGLIQVQERQTKKELPWLRNLPLIGSWFSSRKEDQVKTELIIFITPRILKSEAQEQETTEDRRKKGRLLRKK